MVAIANAGFQLVAHPMHSQDLTLSDFRQFPKLKEHILGKRFSSDEEEFFLEAVKMLESWCEKCIHIGLQEDYRMLKIKIICIFISLF